MSTYKPFDDPKEFKKEVKCGDILWVNYPIPKTVSPDENFAAIKIGIFENSNTKDKSKLLYSIPMGTAWAIYLGELKENKVNPVKSRIKVLVTTDKGLIMVGWIQIVALQKEII